MKNEKKKKIILTTLLGVYILIIYVAIAIIGYSGSDGHFHLTVFNLLQVMINRTFTWNYLLELIIPLISMIPIGFLFPLSRVEKCFSLTMLAGCILGVFFELTKFVLRKPVVCFDAVILTMLGVLIGYWLFTLYCSKSANYIHLLYSYHTNNHKVWIISIVSTFSFFLFFSFLINGGLKALSDIPDSYEATYKESQKENESSLGRGIYSIINKALSQREESISFVNYSANQNDLEQQFYKVLADHPEYFWLSGDGHYQTITIKDYCYYKFFPDMLGDESDIKSRQNLLDHNLEQIINEANRRDSDYEKAKYVHDTLILNCQYDQEACDSILNENSLDGVGYASTAYGCLVNHKAICSGYAKAYQLVMNKLGIECGYVGGSAPDLNGSDVGHAWNYIKLEDEYYFVDITWDDHIYYNGTMKNICYDYFCITTNELLRDHSIDEGQDIPYCKGTKY